MYSLGTRQASSQASLVWEHLNPGLLLPKACPLTLTLLSELFLSNDKLFNVKSISSQWSTATAFQSSALASRLPATLQHPALCVTWLFSLCWWLSVSILHRFWNTRIYLGWISVISTRLSVREASTVHSRIGTLPYKLHVLNCYLWLVWDLLMVHIFTDSTMSLSCSWISGVLYCNITVATAKIRAGRNLSFPRKRDRATNTGFSYSQMCGWGILLGFLASCFISM